MKVYITFGQIHAHSINGKTLDKDCVAAIECNDYESGREKAMDWFDAKLHECYGELPSDDVMQFYPRGVIEI